MKKIKEKLIKAINNGNSIKVKRTSEYTIEEVYKPRIVELNQVYENHKFAVQIDPIEGSLKHKDSNPAKTICNFFAYIRYSIIVDRYYRKDNYFLLEIISLEKMDRTRLIIKEDELASEAWVSNYLNPEHYKFFGNYKILREAINHTKASAAYTALKIDDYSGWKVKKNKKDNDTTWQYNTNKNCYYCRKWMTDFSTQENFEKQVFLNSIEFIEAFPKEISVPLFSYSILSLINEMLRSIRMEPNFIIELVGDRDAFVMQLAELYSNNINPSKGLGLYCLHKGSDNCSDENEHYVYFSEGIDNISKKLAVNKDRTVIIDGLLRSTKRDLAEIDKKLLRNYYNRNHTKKSNSLSDKRLFNALPLLVVDQSVGTDLYLSINVRAEDINKEALLKLRRKEYVLTAFTLDFIDWLENHIYGTRSLFDVLRQNYQMYLRTIYYNNIDLDERKSEIYSWLLLAFNLYLQYGLSQDFISETDFEKYHNFVYKAFIGVDLEEQAIVSKFEEQATQIKNRDEEAIKLLLTVVHTIYKKEQELLSKKKADLSNQQIGWNIKISDEELICFEWSKGIGYIEEYAKRLYRKADIDIQWDSLFPQLKNLKLIKSHNDPQKPYQCKLTPSENPDGKGPQKNVLAFKIEAINTYLKISENPI